MPNWTDQQFEDHHNFSRCNVCQRWTYWSQWATCPVCEINMCHGCLTHTLMPDKNKGSRLCVPCNEVSEAFIAELRGGIKGASRKRSNIVRRWRRKAARRVKDASD